MLIHRSEDFINWAPTAHVAFVREGQHQSFGCGLGEETHEGVCVWNRNNVLLGFHGIWHGDKDKRWKNTTIDLGFSISNDGLNFREPLTEYIFLKNGEDGAWDQGGVLQGQGFENIGEKTYIYYGAWDPRPGGEGAGEEFPPRGGLGIAILERDRFGSLSPREGNKPADFITEEIPLPEAGMLEIYANATGLGEKATLRIAILDTQEHPLAPFADSNAAIVREDGYRTRADFSAELNQDNLPQSIRLRVSFEGQESQQIQLYALYLRTGAV